MYCAPEMHKQKIRVYLRTNSFDFDIKKLFPVINFSLMQLTVTF